MRVYKLFKVWYSIDLIDIIFLLIGFEVGYLIIYNKFFSFIKYDNDFFKNFLSKYFLGVNCIWGFRINIFKIVYYFYIIKLNKGCVSYFL